MNKNNYEYYPIIDFYTFFDSIQAFSLALFRLLTVASLNIRGVQIFSQLSETEIRVTPASFKILSMSR